MDIFFTDPTVVPLPPDEVRIHDNHAEPYPDGRRVRVTLEVDPFQKRPNAELLITNSAGQELSTASIIESMLRKMELTMHLRGASVTSPCTLHATLFYTTPLEPGPEGEPQPVERKVVDTKEITFTIESKPSNP